MGADRWNSRTRGGINSWLSLASHEFFHVWNGKRIAPAVLLDFDYKREAYTRCLWVMEGLTSHYDRWALRSGTAKAALPPIFSSIIALQRTKESTCGPGSATETWEA